MKFKSSIYILLISLFSSCGQEGKSHEFSTDTEHLDVLRREIISGKGIIRFDSIMKFEWDSLIILTPYSLPEEVGEKYNVDLKTVDHFKIESRDDINLIVFLKDNKPTRVIEYPRYPGDFSNNEIEIIEKSKANYRIELTNAKTVDGRQWIELIKK